MLLSAKKLCLRGGLKGAIKKSNRVDANDAYELTMLVFWPVAGVRVFQSFNV